MNEEIERTLKIMQYAEEQEWKNLYKYIIDLQEQLKAYKQAHDKLIMSNPFKENKRLKKEKQQLELQNFNLREDIMIKKMSFPNKEIKDKTFFDLYNMPTYEELKKIINEAKEILNHVNWDNNPLLEGEKPWKALVKIEKILEKCDEV